MKMCKTMPMFILLFIGYLCNNMVVAAHTETPSKHFSATADTETPSDHFSTATDTASPSDRFLGTVSVLPAPQPEAPPRESDHVPAAEHVSAALVAGLSISFVLLFILVIIGVWCAWKKSKGNLTGINPASSDERAVSLKNISTREN